MIHRLCCRSMVQIQDIISNSFDYWVCESPIWTCHHSPHREHQPGSYSPSSAAQTYGDSGQSQNCDRAIHISPPHNHNSSCWGTQYTVIHPRTACPYHTASPSSYSHWGCLSSGLENTWRRSSWGWRCWTLWRAWAWWGRWPSKRVITLGISAVRWVLLRLCRSGVIGRHAYGFYISQESARWDPPLW